MTSRRRFTPDILRAAMGLALDLADPRSVVETVSLRAHAVEAILVADPYTTPAEALRLAGLTGPTAALEVAMEMHGPGWSDTLVRRIAGPLRLLAPARGTQLLLRPAGRVDVTAAICGDPLPGRSALDGSRAAKPAMKATA